MFNKIYNRFFGKEKFHEFSRHNIFIHPQSELGEYTSIGKGTNINGPAYISCDKNAPVVIGKFCAIAFNLRIRAKNHYLGYANLQGKFQQANSLPSLELNKGPVIIGNNVWIGDNVIILPGVNVGDGAVIGAGSIVTKNVECYSIVAGNPAQLIKKRFSDNVINQLKLIAWWDWSEEKIARNKAFFTIDFFEEPDVMLDQYINK